MKSTSRPFVPDTNIWISAYNKIEGDHRKSLALIDRIVRGRCAIILPCPLLPEIVCRLAAYFRNRKIDPVEALKLGRHLQLRPNITWIPADTQFCLHAMELGTRHRLRGMDAIVAYTVLRFDCDLVTNDRDFHDSTISNVINIQRP